MGQDTRGHQASAMRRPVLKAGLRRLSRGPGATQFGIDPDRAIVLDGLDVPAASFDDLAKQSDLAAQLGRAGLLEDGAAVCPGWRALPADHRDRLQPDLAALSLLDPSPSGGKRMLSRRFAARIEIRGGGRVGASLAGLLAASGVGEVYVVDAGPTRPRDLAPGGLRPRSLGRPRGHAATPAPLPSATVLAARRARRRTALPRQRTRGPSPDLVVLAADHDALPPTADLLARRIPHLVAQMQASAATLGPLVVPGRSSCVRCHDLTRADRDPAWPSVAAQLSGAGAPEAGAACDVVLATAVAAHAALQVLTFLETGTAPTVDGTLHLRLPDGTVRRRSWRRHAACDCAWID